MTSNGDQVLHPNPNLKSLKPGPADNDDHARPDPAASPAPAKEKRQSPKKPLSNGNAHVGDDANESEAETVVLDHKDDASEASVAKVIKTERSEDDLRSIKEAASHPHPHSSPPKANGRRVSRDDTKANGVRPGSDRDVDADTDSAPSPVIPAASPPLPAGRGRSVSTLESRKRKLRDDVPSKHSLEPPRQKAKTELRDLRQPTSPATPGLGPGRPHKRSQSTQSAVAGTTGRRRREMTGLAVSTERKQWSDESSGDSSSPRPSQTPNLPPHTRLKRAGHRTVTSPARIMAHGRKLDKYGATQLSRESERGNLALVKAAYEAAPEELDHADFAGFTPLQKAALHGYLDVVEFLIDSGCRTDCESNLNRDTPLIDAVENGHLDVIKMLLHKGHVNPHHQNNKGQRAIDVLDHELEDAEDIEKELKAAMRRQADTSTQKDFTQTALSQSKSASRLLYNEYNTETLVEKAGDGDILAVGELINSNIKPNIACGVAASRGGHYDILSILLASGLKADPDPSKHSETPMLVAIGRGHLKIVNLLLEQDNFDPTRRDREGRTYYEVSEDRRGPKWEQERDILKKAYDDFKLTHKSPKRSRKEAPMASAARLKRKASPQRRERTSSPRPEPKRAKATNAVHAPPKSRRLMSGKEMASREVKRRRRVVDEESSDESDSDDEVRAPAKKAVRPRASSEGERHKPVKKIKNRSEEQDESKRAARAASHGSEDERRPKPTSKPRTKVEKINSAKPTPDPESQDERKSLKNKIQPKPREHTKIKKRRASNDSTDDVKLKKTPNPSAKSTPAPPESVSTPDSVRERRQEEQKQQCEKQAAEAKRKAAEEAARKRDEEEAARKAAEEEELRKKEAEAEAEARRLAEEAEATRLREEEEARQRAAEEAKRQEEAERKRQEELAARQNRVASLPRALRRACELGTNRPLHFSGEELGISAVFLPLFYATSQDLLPNNSSSSTKTYIPSFQIAGILGLRELDLAHLEAPYSTWDRMPFTPQQRDFFLRQYDVALLAQDFRFPMEGTPDFNYTKIQDSIKLARQQFMTMEGLYWVEDQVLFPEVEKVECLQPLLEDIKDRDKWRRVCVGEVGQEVKEEKRAKPRKSFMDMVLKVNGVNGINGVGMGVAARVNGNG